MFDIVRNKKELDNIGAGRVIDLLGDKASEFELYDLVSPVLEHHSFGSHPASVGMLRNGKPKHHSYMGGLAVHTAEVLTFAMGMAQMHQLPVDQTRLLWVAAVWHDFGKVFEYHRVGADSWVRNETYGACGHIAYGLMAWASHCTNIKGMEDGLLANNGDTFVGHLIASHHGLREWGSPDTPKCLAATILHQADMQSLAIHGHFPS